MTATDRTLTLLYVALCVLCVVDGPILILA